MSKKHTFLLTIAVLLTVLMGAGPPDQPPTSESPKSLSELLKDHPEKPPAVVSDAPNWKDARRERYKAISARNADLARFRAEAARQAAIRARSGVPGFRRECPGGKCGGR